MGRDDDDFETVDLLKLESLGVGRTGHTGQFPVHAEVVLEGDRGQRLVLLADLDTLLGLDGLMQTV